MCFEKYLKNINVFYFCFDLFNDRLLNFLRIVPFDYILFDNSIFYYRDTNSKETWQKFLDKFLKKRGRWDNAVKGILPQDEYRGVERIREFIQTAGIDVIYTLADKKTREIFYPREQLDYKKIYTIFPGYIDEADQKYCENKLNDKMLHERRNDIGYRARKPTYALGNLGFLKTKIPEIFSEKAIQNRLTADVGNTEGKNAKSTFYGREWFDFLLNCRVVPGSLSGSSIMDADGLIAKKVDYYLRCNPKISYETVKKDFLWKFEGNLIHSAPSPRIFEAAMTKTCQILVEGNYRIMKPGIDYIELKNDFSNIDEVFEKIKDKSYCESIAENAYNHLVKSNKYTYRIFANKIYKSLSHIKKDRRKKFIFPYIIKLIIAVHDYYLEKIYKYS